MSLARTIARARAERSPDLIAQAIPYADFLGISTREEPQGGLLSSLAYRERNVGNPTLPALHGGALGAFLETAAILELLWHLDTTGLPKPITVTIDYLRAAGPSETFARATITKRGMRIANLRAVAWQADPDKPVATATASFLLSPPA